MLTMIPIAILTSERAEIIDMCVEELTNEIVKMQVTNWLIEDIRENGLGTNQA